MDTIRAIKGRLRGIRTGNEPGVSVLNILSQSRVSGWREYTIKIKTALLPNKHTGPLLGLPSLRPTLTFNDDQQVILELSDPETARSIEISQRTFHNRDFDD